ncbi:GTP-binding protein [Streptomyces acidiscabies]|uniref:GTP-binding protein n=1 Tax=Streptomyces acidiscabies TaxID=42234 RepID=UPI0009615C58|nr:ATP/GTP-binding protein [Streptomyces acidiscabies]GAV38298.1 hypothetical protein Saa2_01177 [Streptomyces acidiscabies]
MKLVIGGGFGVGKTTAIGSVSDIRPLSTEETLTEASAGSDNLDGVESKTVTTVAFDFGRVSWDDGPDPLDLYLFGTPGQPRFWSLWNDLAHGAFGAVVLTDPRKLETSFPAVDFFEQVGLPFVIAVNMFPGADRWSTDEIHEAFDVPAGVPVLTCDARNADSVAEVLFTLVRHAMTGPYALLDA